MIVLKFDFGKESLKLINEHTKQQYVVETDGFGVLHLIEVTR